ncbi:hypothetical protein FH972_021643 [Carpinus fangiana]|uniref:Nucleoside phosphorylase domain-containing protein n=1 Tax=Carpinus fangiana TaxID=176857 RepID=A0A5N6KQA2_9ROSI|nr:hypothetical protein FH972_021643 [Carpinus fangiana]
MGQAQVQQGSNNFGNTTVSHGQAALGNFNDSVIRQANNNATSPVISSNKGTKKTEEHRREAYTVAWICALPREQAALVLDDVHEKLQSKPHETTYILGRIDVHNVVVACLPTMGTTAAARCVARLEDGFKSLRFILLVGIGGGVPTKTDIRLGDVIVSAPTKKYGGVLQYDYGTKFQTEHLEIRPSALGRPSELLVTAIAAMNTRYTQSSDGKTIGEVLHHYTTMLGEKFPQMQSVRRPRRDQLFAASYRHLDDDLACDKCNCDAVNVVNRPLRSDAYPRIHAGLIASGNEVMRDAIERDRMAHETGVLCFEMEAAGLQTSLGWLVVRGVCDYCDSHKNKDWQDYAAAVATAYAKELLKVVPGSELEPEHPDTISAMSNLAVTLSDQGKTEEAASMQQQVLEMRQRILGPERPNPISAMKDH